MEITSNDITLDLEHFTIKDSNGILQLNPPRSYSQKSRVYLKITNSCNAQCKYCFQGTHQCTHSIILNQYNLLLKKVLQNNHDIVIFGGEPFLAQNLQSLEFLFAIDPEKKFTFFSNGYFDYSVRAFLTQNIKQVETIIISIDGLECTHNRRRPFGRENGFARILSNLHFLREKKIPFAIQINVDSNNSDEIVRLVQYLSDHFSQEYPILLNKVLHTEDELPTETLLKLFVELKKTVHHANLFVNSVVANKISDLLTEREISCKRCNICNTKVYDFTNNLIYCCPQISTSIIGAFDSEKEIISEKALIPYVQHSSKYTVECQKCALRNFCEFGCLDDNTIYRDRCRDYTLDAIQIVLQNLDIFLDPLVFEDEIS